MESDNNSITPMQFSEILNNSQSIKQDIKNSYTISPDRWVLSKLVDMNIKNIENIQDYISNSSKQNISKEEILNSCLDVLNFDEIVPNIENEEKEEKPFDYSISEILFKSFFEIENKYKKKNSNINDKNYVFINRSCPEINRKNQNDYIINIEDNILLNLETNSKNSENQIKNIDKINEIKETNFIDFSNDIESQTKNPNLLLNNSIHSIKKSNSLKDNTTNLNNLINQITISRKKNSENLSSFNELTDPNKNLKEFPLNMINSLVLEATKPKKNINDIPIQNNSLRICEICLLELHTNDFTKIGDCKDEYCKQCIYSYITELIETGRVNNMKCPNPQCKIIYTEDQIKKNLGETTRIFKKYKKFKLILQLDKDPSIRWCINQNCDKFLKGSSSNPKLICDCGEIICFNCSKKWHEGVTCNEKIDQEYEEYKSQMNITNCPKCKSRIEKATGCNHMTCRCGYQFCWICTKKYTTRHFKKYNIFGCPGMMYRNFKRDKNFQKNILKTRIIYSFKLFLLLLCFLIFFPVLAIGLVFCVLNIFHFRKKRFRINCENICISSLLFVIGIFISPLIIILIIFFGLKKLLKGISGLFSGR